MMQVIQTNCETRIKYESKPLSQEDVPSFCIPLAHGTETMQTSHVTPQNLPFASAYARALACALESILALCPFPRDRTNAWSALSTTTLTGIEVAQPTEGRV